MSISEIFVPGCSYKTETGAFRKFAAACVDLGLFLPFFAVVIASLEILYQIGIQSFIEFCSNFIENTFRVENGISIVNNIILIPIFVAILFYWNDGFFAKGKLASPGQRWVDLVILTKDFGIPTKKQRLIRFFARSIYFAPFVLLFAFQEYMNEEFFNNLMAFSMIWTVFMSIISFFSWIGKRAMPHDVISGTQVCWEPSLINRSVNPIVGEKNLIKQEESNDSETIKNP